MEEVKLLVIHFILGTQIISKFKPWKKYLLFAYIIYMSIRRNLSN